MKSLSSLDRDSLEAYVRTLPRHGRNPMLAAGNGCAYVRPEGQTGTQPHCIAAQVLVDHGVKPEWLYRFDNGGGLLVHLVINGLRGEHDVWIENGEVISALGQLQIAADKASRLRGTDDELAEEWGYAVDEVFGD